MASQNKDQKQLRGIFPVDSKYSHKSQDSSDVQSVFSGKNQCYALMSEDETVKKFQVILRSGKKYRVPYALLPITELSDKNDELCIMAYQLLIVVQGRNIEPIEEYLAEETLLWMSESPSGKDDGSLPVFISNIIIEGKAISKEVN